ncbi:hypothetical protein KOW79_004089 [Hemibagrus wyckioides]|uniref:TIR domain-containing protein n=1 Tax=Hemibagrus wyckioides TaxID=337641 RepID=A0A9D3SR37_9TELE|nr:hypothetical protein KOW79_004089 [Hemibagrus wyckioides]
MQILWVMFGPGLYLVFVLDQLSLVKTMNPKFYPCDNNTDSSGNIHLDCKHRDLTSIPKFMSLFIISLNLEENRIHQILWAGHKGYTPLQGNNMNNQHDAFVVFDTKNKAVRDWIYNEMLINLESRGRRKFRLCLEERDWVPGVSCIENLHNSVYNSKKTVFVLTNQGGCASVNGVIKQAFLLVQQRLLDEKVDVAIVVLLDPIFPKLKYLQMRKRLCRKSVLSWPKNPRAQLLFWNNLHIALASDTVRSYDKKVTESFLSNDIL